MPRPFPHAPRSAVAPLFAFLALAACARTERATDVAVANVQAAAQAQTTSLSTSDAFFMDQAARAGLAEVAEGRMMRERAGRADIRQFAARMVADHGAVNEELAALAQRKGITPPATPSAAQQASLDELGKLRGRALDRKYLDEQVAEHQQVLKLFQDEARQGTDPDVKAFAARHAGALAEHLDMAMRLGGHAPSS